MKINMINKILLKDFNINEYSTKLVMDNSQVNKIVINTKDLNYLFWLGGFVEGEGSVCVAITKSLEAPFGILIQPEFNICQHINGIKILESFKVLFNGKGN